MLLDAGWSLVATHGNQRQCKHPSRLGRVTVPGKPRRWSCARHSQQQSARPCWWSRCGG